MPKINVDFAPASALPEEWRLFLMDRFEPKVLERLERLGGRLTLSLTIPQSSTARHRAAIKFTDEELVGLRVLSSDKSALQSRLNQYDTKNLRLVCERLGIAVSKKNPRVELIAEIVRFLTNDAVWAAILRAQPGTL